MDGKDERENKINNLKVDTWIYHEKYGEMLVKEITDDKIRLQESGSQNIRAFKLIDVFYDNIMIII
jgi:hypothetical protein